MISNDPAPNAAREAGQLKAHVARANEVSVKPLIKETIRVTLLAKPRTLADLEKVTRK